MEKEQQPLAESGRLPTGDLTDASKQGILGTISSVV
jgi:hypothetical protein